MATSCKQRKIDDENRSFQKSWADDFFFVLPDRHNARPVCIICHEMVRMIKSGNIRQHFETKWDEYYNANYPPKSDLRSHKIEALKSSFEASSSMMTKATTTQSNVTEASLCTVWVLGRNKKSFTDAEVVKECMMSASSVLFSGKKCVELIQQTLLSDSTASRRADDLLKMSIVSYCQILNRMNCLLSCVINPLIKLTCLNSVCSQDFWWP